MDATQAQELLRDIVFRIRGEKGHGTGFFISPDGWALTAYHLISDEARQREYRTPVVGDGPNATYEFEWYPDGEEWQRKYDLAVLKLKAGSAVPPRQLVDCRSLSNHNSTRVRAAVWKSRDVFLVGYPDGDRSVYSVLLAKADGDLPIRESRRYNGDSDAPNAPPALDLHVDPGAPQGFGGLSGGPVLDRITGCVVGVCYGCQGRHVRANELLPLVEAGIPPSRYIRTNPGRIDIPRRHWVKALSAGATIAVAGVLFNKLTPSPPPRPVTIRIDVHADASLPSTRLAVQPPPQSWLAGVRRAAALETGSKMTVSLRSSAGGYLYVVDQEVGPEGVPGHPYLVYPTRRIHNGANRVAAGGEVSFPGHDDNPPHLELKPSSDEAGYRGELFTALLLSSPLTAAIPGDGQFLEPDHPLSSILQTASGTRLAVHSPAAPAAVDRLFVPVAPKP